MTTIPLESPPLPEQPVDGAPRARALKLLVGGVLALSATAGLVLNHTAAAGRTVNAAPRPADGQPAAVSAPMAAVPAPSVKPVASPGATRVRAEAPIRGTEIRLAQLAAPEDPFRPSAAMPAAAPPTGFALAGAAPGKPFPAHLALPPAGRAAATASAGPKEPPVRAAPAEPSTPRPDDLAVTGIIQGDPPLAVVRYAGNTLFLKIGDQVADTWRLVEIKERSVRFALGEQRVEVPIKGGSSE